MAKIGRPSKSGEPKRALIAARVDEKTRRMLKVLERYHRLSSAEALSKAIQQVFGDLVKSCRAEGELELAPLSDARTDAELLAKMAFHRPDLLSSPERDTWRAVLLDGGFWLAPEAAKLEQNFAYPVLEAKWDELACAL